MYSPHSLAFSDLVFAATSIPIVILVFLGFIGTVFLAFIATVSGVVIRKASYLASPANSEPNFWNN